jgi:hypothetical protein
MMERERFNQQFGERSVRRDAGNRGGIPSRGERVGIPIDIEARLSTMDAERGLPITLETDACSAADIMDDRLNELAAEIFERGDQASQDAIITMSMTYFLYSFNTLNTGKQVAYLQSYQNMRLRHPEINGYRITANEKRLFNSILSRGAAYTIGGNDVVEPVAFYEDGEDIVHPLTDADQLEDLMSLGAMDAWEDHTPKTTGNTTVAIDEWIKRRGYTVKFGALGWLNATEVDAGK